MWWADDSRALVIGRVCDISPAGITACLQSGIAWLGPRLKRLEAERDETRKDVWALNRVIGMYANSPDGSAKRRDAKQGSARRATAGNSSKRNPSCPQ